MKVPAFVAQIRAENMALSNNEFYLKEQFCVNACSNSHYLSGVSSIRTGTLMHTHYSWYYQHSRTTATWGNNNHYQLVKTTQFL